jgi:hypothetical protein
MWQSIRGFAHGFPLVVQPMCVFGKRHAKQPVRKVVDIFPKQNISDLVNVGCVCGSAWHILTSSFSIDVFLAFFIAFDQGYEKSTSRKLKWTSLTLSSFSIIGSFPPSNQSA